MDDNDLFNDAAPVEASDTDLASVGALAEKAERMADEVAAMEDVLKERKRELRELLERDLPDAMDAVGLSELKTKAGRKLTVKDEVRASIPKAAEAEAFSWLRDTGHEDLIKHEVKVALDRGKDNLAKEITTMLARDYGVEPSDKETVHPQTLSAWCREQLAQGVELPADILGLYIGRKVTIK